MAKILWHAYLNKADEARSVPTKRETFDLETELERAKKKQLIDAVEVSADLLKKGASPQWIENRLVELGYDAEVVQVVAAGCKLQADRNDAKDKKFLSDFKKFLGVFLIVGGLVGLVYSINSDSDRWGRYVLAIGAIPFGANLIYRGIKQSKSESLKSDRESR